MDHDQATSFRIFRWLIAARAHAQTAKHVAAPLPCLPVRNPRDALRKWKVKKKELADGDDVQQGVKVIRLEEKRVWNVGGVREAIADWTPARQEELADSGRRFPVLEVRGVKSWEPTWAWEDRSPRHG